MKFYITTEDIQKLKRSFLNLKLFSIINVPEILEKLGYTYNTIDDYAAFIVNKKINKLIENYVKSKRTRGIIYCNPWINESIIKNINKIVQDISNISDVVLLDDFNVPKLHYLYPNFNEIIFFPSIKKIRIIEAKSIKDKIEWKT